MQNTNIRMEDNGGPQKSNIKNPNLMSSIMRSNNELFDTLKL